MPRISLSDQKLFYARQGQAAAGQPNVVLVHGAAGSHLDWPPQLRKMAGSMVYALDLPGHGRSDKPGRTTIDGYTDVVSEFVAALKLRNVILVGHSMGGAIAQMIGLRQPAWLAGLVLVGTGARLRVAPLFLDGVMADFEAVADRLMNFYWGDGTPAEVIQHSRRMWIENDPAVVHGDFLACDRFDITDRLEEITTPVLVIGSSADRMTPLKYSQYLAEHLPRAKLVTVDDCGHMLALERADVVTTAVWDFVSRFQPDH